MKKTACVTGGSGFLALHLVKQLLEKGYNVNATVRDLKDSKKISALTELQQKFNNLKLFEADLLKLGSFDEAVAGCEYVFHTASPFFYPKPDADLEKVLIKPAEEGTKNVLSSVLKHKSDVKRVIITSSVAAICNVFKPEENHNYTEKDWNTTSKMDEPNGAYRISKTRAEKAAWEFCQKNNIEMVSVNPFFIIGEVLNTQLDKNSINTSSQLVLNYLSGDVKEIPQAMMGFVDVKDVAKAHILAAETKCAAGQRYLCVSEVVEMKDFAKMLKEMYPNYPVPEKLNEKTKLIPFKMDNSKIIKELGMKFRPLSEFLKETVECLIKCQYLDKR